MNTSKITRMTEKARILVKNDKFYDAEKEYQKIISLIDNEKNTEEQKVALWTTKAEYLWFRASYLTKYDTEEISRQRAINAIRYIYKTYEMNEKYNKQLKKKGNNLVQNYIKVYGCIIPETETHVDIKCPIRIRNTGLGKFGFSTAFHYNKLICSTCGKEILKDIDCKHVPGREYDGQICTIIAKDIEVDHIALTTKPKDPNARITFSSMPKKEIYDEFSEEEIKFKQENNLPLVCNMCKNQNITPTEIDMAQFFFIQGLDKEPNM